MFLYIKVVDELPVHEKKHVERSDVGADICFTEVSLVILQSEVLENLLAFAHEETFDLLGLRLLNKHLSVFKLGTMVWIVSHQVFSEEDAWVKPIADAWINFIYSKGARLVINIGDIHTLTFFICQSIDFASQKLNSWQKNWVQLSCQVDIVMLIRVGQLDDLLLKSEQVLDISSLVVFLEQLGLIVVASHVVTALRFVLLQTGKMLETVS